MLNLQHGFDTEQTGQKKVSNFIFSELQLLMKEFYKWKQSCVIYASLSKIKSEEIHKETAEYIFIQRFLLFYSRVFIVFKLLSEYCTMTSSYSVNYNLFL